MLEYLVTDCNSKECSVDIKLLVMTIAYGYDRVALVLLK